MAVFHSSSVTRAASSMDISRVSRIKSLNALHPRGAAFRLTDSFNPVGEFNHGLYPEE